MADDPRDRYRPKHPTPPTPPRGVKPASASESWEDGQHTDVGPPIAVPTTNSVPMTKTPAHGVAVSRTISDSEMLQHVARRAGETKNLAIDTKNTATTTLDRVDALRRETREDLRDVHEKVDAVIEVVGELRENVSDIRGEVKAQDKHATLMIEQNRTIIGMLERRETTHQEIQLARLNVDTTTHLTDLELAKREKTLALDRKEKADADRRDRNKAIFERVVVPLLVAVVAFVILRYLT